MEILVSCSEINDNTVLYYETFDLCGKMEWK